ncbi:unnamed protein product [Meganyctiphanes norvegica]|uniref:Uncharacterized protein n=1 Tax=Meganyctiphanes norvegica TaxID=48144 RepID=A0AAV2QLU1_MEGNR
MSKFDDLLTQLGTGRWNFIFFAVCSYCCFLVPFHVLSGPFIVPKQEHSCRSPLAHRQESWIDTSNTTQDSCHFLNDGNETECTEWDYDNQTFTLTITSEQYIKIGAAYGAH